MDIDTNELETKAGIPHDAVVTHADMMRAFEAFKETNDEQLEKRNGDVVLEEKLAREVLEYFLRNPQAADNLEGVAHWRLLDQAVHRTLTETKASLDWLVSQGYLREIVMPSLAPIYALNPQKRDEAEEFLNSATKGNRTKAPES